jgi:hypothetical protein
MSTTATVQKPFNVCYLGAIFADVAELLRHGLEGLGYQAFAGAGNVGVDCRNVILGAHLLQDFSLIPPDSIIVNLEQLGSTSTMVSEAYLDCLRRHHVWDYSPRNLAWLAENGMQASLVRLGFAPALARVTPAPVQDIDVLFYGAVNERRQHILDGLRQAGVNVVALTGGVVREELDTYIARSKVVLNMHYYETKIFEIVRVSYLLNNHKAVVAEAGPDTEIEDELRRALLGVRYDQLVAACRVLVGDETRRRHVEQAGWTVFSSRSQAAFMREAVDAALRFEANRPAPLPTILNLGSGGDYRDDCLNVDVRAACQPDAVADLGRPGALDEPVDAGRFGRIRWPRARFEQIVARDVLQHVGDLTTMMTHCLELLAPDGLLDITVPHDLSLGAWQHPGHVRAFNETSWHVYTDGYRELGWQDARFEQADTKVQVSRYGMELRAQGLPMEQILRQPRAVDSINVLLRKRALA